MLPSLKSDVSFDEVDATNDFVGAQKALEAIAATRSLTEKKKLIALHSNPFFRTVVEYALNPYRMFKMSGSIPTQDNASNPNAGRLGLPDKILNRLNVFASQSGVSKHDKQEFSDLVRACGPEAVSVVNRILDKDLRCGASVQTFRAALPAYEDLLPVHHPMKGIDDLGKFYKAAGDRKNICWSIKLDGTRCHAVVDMSSRSVLYLSSNGKEIPNFKCFDKELIRAAWSLQRIFCWDHIIFDGEVINVSGDFSRHMSQFRRLKDMDASGFRFRIFDVLPKFRPFHTAFMTRYGKLLLDSGLPLWRPGSYDSPCSVLEHLPLEESPRSLAKRMISHGFEGIMLKTYDGIYEDKRVNYWCKIKAVHTEDLPVVGKVEGTGKYAGTLGALIVRRGDVEVEVGSGFTDAERAEFWVESPKCIEVKYQEALASGSLRFPVFVRVRDDKA